MERELWVLYPITRACIPPGGRHPCDLVQTKDLPKAPPANTIVTLGLSINLCISGGTNIHSIAGGHNSAHNTLERVQDLNFQGLSLGDVEEVGLCITLRGPLARMMVQHEAGVAHSADPGLPWCCSLPHPMAVLWAMMDMPLASHCSHASLLFAHTYPVPFLCYLAPGQSSKI